MNPFKTRDPFDYPGWILPVIKIFLFCVFYYEWSVICNNGMSKPAKVLPNV